MIYVTRHAAFRYAVKVKGLKIASEEELTGTPLSHLKNELSDKYRRSVILSDKTEDILSTYSKDGVREPARHRVYLPESFVTLERFGGIVTVLKLDPEDTGFKNTFLTGWIDGIPEELTAAPESSFEILVAVKHGRRYYPYLDHVAVWLAKVRQLVGTLFIDEHLADKAVLPLVGGAIWEPIRLAGEDAPEDGCVERVRESLMSGRPTFLLCGRRCLAALKPELDQAGIRVSDPERTWEILSGVSRSLTVP